MKYFKDQEKQQEILGDFDFGIGDAGKTYTFEFWAYNEVAAEIRDIEWTLEKLPFAGGQKHDELEMIESPIAMGAFAVAKIIIEWKPNVTIKEGLKARLRAVGKSIWG